MAAAIACANGTATEGSLPVIIMPSRSTLAPVYFAPPFCIFSRCGRNPVARTPRSTPALARIVGAVLYRRDDLVSGGRLAHDAECGGIGEILGGPRPAYKDNRIEILDAHLFERHLRGGNPAERPLQRPNL